MFSEWAAQKNPPKKELEEMTESELDESFCQFYSEVKTKKGEEYSRSSLLAMRQAIERYLNNPPFNKCVQLSSAKFVLSNKMLNAKIKDLKRQGKQNVQHKSPILPGDLLKLKSSPAIQLSSPLSLLRNVWFCVVLYWCRRGREGQRELKPESFKFEVDEDGRCFATMSHDEITKNHQGGITEHPSYEKHARLYETESPNDGYKALKLYLSKLNPKCKAFFQFPRRDWSDEKIDSCWYENRPLGVNTLGNMMKAISIEAKLSKVYTNHCVRATAITLWSDSGIEDRQICQISGHRNTASLQHYNAQPSAQQLRQYSNVLSNALQGVPQNPGCSNQIQRPSVFLSSFSQNNNATTTRCEVLGGMFNSCSIENVNIQLVNPQGRD